MTPVSMLPVPGVNAHPLDMSDDDLRRVARQRPQLAFELVVRRFQERLLCHAGFILRDREEAHDVVQEVLIKAMREPRFFDADFKMQAWLYRVTRNLCFNLGRDRRRRDVILYTQRRSEAGEDDPLHNVFLGEQRHEMMQAIAMLSPDHREILTLRYYEDCSYAEIAETLDIALGTVMSRLSRARDRLQATMAESALAPEAAASRMPAA